MIHLSHRVFPVLSLTGLLAASAAAQMTSERPGAAAGAESRAILEQVAEAYRKAPALRDTVSLSTNVRGFEQSVELRYVLGADGAARFEAPGIKVTALDGHLYLENDQHPTRYLKTELRADMMDTLATVYPTWVALPVPLAMRADRGIDAYVKAISLGMLEQMTVGGHRLHTDEEGRTRHEVMLAAATGSATVRIDPESMFIDVIDLSFMSEDGTRVDATMQFNPVIEKEAAGLVTFDPGDREAVGTLAELEALRRLGKIAVGDAPPDFSLATLDGASVTLSQMKGSVVVLDFWATWCVPCRKGLPLLQQFADWADQSGKPIRVLAVNVMERAPSVEQRRAKVAAFWKSMGFTMPTALDLEDTVAGSYGFGGIPVTLIIDAEGKVARIHQGFSPDMLEMLQNEVRQVLSSGGD